MWAINVPAERDFESILNLSPNLVSPFTYVRKTCTSIVGPLLFTTISYMNLIWPGIIFLRDSNNYLSYLASLILMIAHGEDAFHREIILNCQVIWCLFSNFPMASHFIHSNILEFGILQRVLQPFLLLCFRPHILVFSFFFRYSSIMGFLVIIPSHWACFNPRNFEPEFPTSWNVLVSESHILFYLLFF